jgi:hypothetical protein
MNVTGNNSIQNNVFDGVYTGYLSTSGLDFSKNPVLSPDFESIFISRGIDPGGVTGISVFFNSGDLNIDSGYLGSPRTIVSGASEQGSSLSGYLFYRINKPIIGVCHGVGRDANAWYDGFNFYNAFHPEGYFAPPFGQHTTVVKLNEDGRTALDENGNCSSLTEDEYNDLFGIVSQTDNGAEASADGITRNTISFINSPAIACPQDLSVTYYWHEKQYKIIAGTAVSVAGSTFYNNNPIPTALDNFISKTALRYQESGEDTGTTVDNGNGTRTAVIKHHIQFTGGKPIPEFSSVGGNTINSMTCPGLIAEGKISLGTQVQSQLLDAPDVLGTPSKGAFDFFNWWNIWHFLFKENSDGFPFDNGADNYGDNVGLMKTPWGGHSSQLFEAELSNSDRYWERRQCPEAISHLPHTFGASIFACPSYHFDVPYYAVTRKFGFYGTRFFNGCVSLQLDYPLSGLDSHREAIEIPSGTTYTTPEEGEPEMDKGINYGFSHYTNLLRMARAEENSADFYGLNTRLFLWGNKSLIKSSPEYSTLSSNPKFNVLFDNLFNDFDSLFPNGKNDLITGQPLFQSGASSVFYPTGKVYEALGSNKEYTSFVKELRKTLQASSEVFAWNTIENSYGRAFLNGGLYMIDTGFYQALSDAKEERLKNRYIENYVKGNAIDLYPTNKIYFGYDKAGSFINSSDWGKASNGFGASSDFNDTGLGRSFFVGAYSNGEDVSGMASYLQTFTTLRDSSFYPGYFNSNIGLELPNNSYSAVLTGWTDSGSSISPLGDGWVAAGYNGVGELKENFSCFTPIFVQQPFPKVYCKIGQSPTFRALAVDYHTIPEDKMNIRWPEIVYWMKKLKLCDSDYKNRYPLSYKWYRIKKSDCSGDFSNFLLNPDFSKVSPSDPSGDWCALEGDGPYCTLIHPKDCEPVFSPNPAWSYRYRNLAMYQTAQQNNFYMTKKKGAIKGVDDTYFYFCMARGRFGIRISEPSELFIEDWLKFDVSIQNGGNVVAAPTVKFVAGNYEIACNPVSVEKYAGFAKDDDAIPEDVVEKQLPPPNRGYGDVFSYKFVGMWKWRGATQSYTPGTLKDTRGLREIWGRMVHYGALAKYHINLSQNEGDILYGRKHLPTCDSNYKMPESQEGIKVKVDGIVHWANMQQAIANTDGRYGVRWDKLTNAGMLYVPSTSVTNAGQVTTSPGIGQWQWGNNLGTIHVFGWNSPNSDLTQTLYPMSSDDIQKLKQNLLKNGVLAGKNCGWHKGGLGRNMSYWIEGFSSFYVYCDTLKKKNITNYNYMNPGLRHTNSSIQYFWLGKPHNAYLDRYPLFGPYAFQWKVRRHNRDRNGNGMSEGFYSYGWNQNYSMQYDPPAIYGLNIKYGHSSRDLLSLQKARNDLFGPNPQAVKNVRFGFTNGDGGARPYGNVWLGNINENMTPTKEYVLSGADFATDPEFRLYGCSDEDLASGRCFDPCLSMRYQMGFLAGGKKQDLMNNWPSGVGYRLVANSPVVDGTPVNNTAIDSSGVYFRGAFGTPHLQYVATGALATHELNGFSPCFDGGADHCNYITPTLNLGTSMYQESKLSDFIKNIKIAADAISLGGGIRNRRINYEFS